MNYIKILTLFSGFSFLTYGFLCLFSNQMKKEFIRFKLPKFRVLTGLLEVLGGLGQILGFYYYPQVAFIATLGLAILMVLGFMVRLRIKDTFLESFPAFFYMIVNLVILILEVTL